jgi:hypothetical protein
MNDLGVLPNALITRCAWCDRYETGGLWLPKEDVAAFLRDDGSTVTHGICPNCVARSFRAVNGQFELTAVRRDAHRPG